MTQAVCVNGVVTPPTLTLPEKTDGITYTVDQDPPYAPGQTVVVTAGSEASGIDITVERVIDATALELSDEERSRLEHRLNRSE